MAIFNSYVKLPEGTCHQTWLGTLRTALVRWKNHRTIAGGFSSNPAAKQGCKSNHSMMDIMGYKTNKHIDTYMSLSNHRRPKLPSGNLT